ncbi:class I SAM-dependent methyltransferase [Vibrio salinus]|uniref:class I SAM-dependent methyltransferase n=1 Tax=Vibrio salinus TaxID=2899784 RepID=UPI001E58F1D2|nr:class I SAM-dependent methyltransferase [Vibrio salinus]MCE0492896.1 class I SAM-dependent methyltransferase [Vibrio salinus]
MWDNIYDVDEYVYGRCANDFLRNNINMIPKGNILCLADGEGRNSVFLAKQGYHVTAVELSAVAIKKAQKLADENHVNIEFIQADLQDFNLGKSRWDAIVSIFCHLPETIRSSLHQRIEQSLKPNGIYLAEAYTPKQLNFKTGGPANINMMISSKIIKQELPALHFRLLMEKERYIQEGIKHNGPSHVVQVIAQKQ